jgi:hypothetical protein
VPTSRKPSQAIVLVNVTFSLGLPQYQYLLFANGLNGDPVGVGPGDQIGWFVRVEQGQGWIQPPYTLNFKDSSILGTGSISVPNGGFSGFSIVQVLSGETKYTLAVSGILPVSDPKIQVDPNGTVIIAARGAQFNVRWTAATNVMEIESNGAWIQFPPAGLKVAVGDSVQFFAVLTPPADFEILFPPPLNKHAWESPFGLNDFMFLHTNQGANENTDNLPVADQSDGPGTQFQFMATLTDGSLQSAPYIIILS